MRRMECDSMQMFFLYKNLRIWQNTSQDTAIRDIKDLIQKGILQQEQPGGRSTNYELVKV